MSSNLEVEPINRTPYLRTSRNFPQEAQPLAVEVNRSYLDIAQAVNQRTIGLFPTNRPAITGDSYFVTVSQNTIQRQQSFRQVYAFAPISPATVAIAPGGTLTIPHGITDLQQFVHIYGTCITTQPDFRPIPYSSIAGMGFNIDLRVDSANIIIVNGIGASAPPAIVSGLIILEWIVNV